MDYMIRCFVRWLKFWFSLFSKSMQPQKSLRKCLPIQKKRAKKNVHRNMVNPCNLQFSLQNIYIRCIYLIVAWRSFHLIFRSTCVCVCICVLFLLFIISGVLHNSITINKVQQFPIHCFRSYFSHGKFCLRFVRLDPTRVVSFTHISL